MKNIYYNYPNASKTALKNINLDIPVNKTIGLVGATGSGKSTTLYSILSEHNEEGINISTISTSEIKISILIEEKHLESAVQSLHKVFELDQSLGS